MYSLIFSLPTLSRFPPNVHSRKPVFLTKKKGTKNNFESVQTGGERQTAHYSLSQTRGQRSFIFVLNFRDSSFVSFRDMALWSYGHIFSDRQLKI